MVRQYTTDQFFDRTHSSSDNFPLISPSFPGEYVISISSRIPAITSVCTLPSRNQMNSANSFESINQPEIDDLWEDSPPRSQHITKKQRFSDDNSSTKTQQKGSSGYSGLVYVRRPKSLDIRFVI